jgi:mono/diheme cytochrome c family protein
MKNRGFLAGIIAMLGLGILIAVAVVFLGAYNVAATAGHMAPTQWLLHTTMTQSVRLRAQEIRVPKLDDPQRVQSGFREFNEMCVGCHGAPGAERSEVGLGLMPQPPDLSVAVKHWTPEELFWILKHGVKMTGMPAFGPTHDDKELWTVVAFLRTLPGISPAEYQALVAANADMPSGHGHGTSDAEGTAHSHDE